jgi:hypothetical protein
MAKTREPDVQALDEELEALDPATTPARDARELRELADLASRRLQIDDEIAQKVADARAVGMSWGKIAIALGVSRQAARQRYGLEHAD